MQIRCSTLTVGHHRLTRVTTGTLSNINVLHDVVVHDLDTLKHHGVNLKHVELQQLDLLL